MKYVLSVLLVVTMVPFVSGMTSDTSTRSQLNSNDQICKNCATTNAPKMCGACKVTFYCSLACQRHDWSTHKAVCKTIAPRAPLYVARAQKPVMLSKEMSNIFERAFQASGNSVSLNPAEQELMRSMKAAPLVRASSELEETLHAVQSGLQTHVDLSEFFEEEPS